jgi:hypothetical protein
MFQGLSVASDDPTAFEYAGDMAYSADAFRYYLKAATQAEHIVDRGHQLEATQGGKTWRITLGPERFEGIALLKMARMTMHMRLEGFSRAEGDAFLARFLQHYQRGGG